MNANTDAQPMPRVSLTQWRCVTAVYWIALVIGTHWPRLSLNLSNVQAGENVWQLDKAIHASAYAVLTLLLYIACPFGKRARPATRVCAVATVALAYGLLDEWTQGAFPTLERVFSLTDLLANAVGIAIAATAVMLPHRSAAPQAVKAARWACLVGGVLSAPLAFMPGVAKLVAQLGAPRDLPLDNLAHFLVAFAATWLLIEARPLQRHLGGYAIGVVLAGLAIAAPVAELIQQAVGRSEQLGLRDMLYHYVGMTVACAAWLGCGLWPEANDDRKGENTHNFVGHAVLVSALTLVSRLTGLVRDAVFAALLGLSSIADAFFVAFLIPNLFRRLFGEGALSAAFIPAYTALLKEDEALAKRFASVCLTLLTVLLLALTLLVEGVLLAMLHWGDWSTRGETTLQLAATMLPYMPMICLVALTGGILQVHRRFGPPAAAPVLLNLTLIGIALWSGAFIAQWENAGEAPRQIAAAKSIAIGVLIAGVLQLAWQAGALLRCTSLTRQFHGTRPHLAKMLRMMVPMLLGLAVFQINALMDSLIALMASAPTDTPNASFHLFGRWFYYPVETGSVAALNWAQRLYQFPLGVFGIAIATAIFPALAAAAAPQDEKDESDFAEILRKGLRLTLFIGLPASLGLILVSTPLCRVIYERQAFSTDDAARVATILTGYAASVWAYSMTHVLTRAFYAKQDVKTPLRISVTMVGFNLTLNLILIWPLGAAGLAWSTATSAVLQVALLLIAIRKHVPRPVDRGVLRGWGKTVIATGLMVAVLLPLVVTRDFSEITWRGALAWLLGLTVLGKLTITVAAALLRCDELKWLLRRSL